MTVRSFGRIYTTVTNATDFHLDYGIIGNCQISALISREASIDWLCLPRFDSPSVFAKLLDEEKGGSFSILPQGEYTYQQRYVRNTNILETVFTANDWELSVLDFCPRYRNGSVYRRPIEIHRILIPRKGTPPIRVQFNPQMNYAQNSPKVFVTDASIVAQAGNCELHLQSTLSLEMIHKNRTQLLHEPACFLLTYQEPYQGDISDYVNASYRKTLDYWQTWVKHCAIPQEFQDEVIRSALVLKLHVFEDTGAIIAATTTSIPEILGTERCWDYRYCWLRDTYFVLDALNELSQFEEMENYIYFLKNICRKGVKNLQPLYGISAEKTLTEEILPHLSGAAKAGVVRTGNAAYTHLQYDMFGEMVLSLYPLFTDRRLVRHSTESTWPLVKSLAEEAIEVFPKPDSGIWEFRNEMLHNTFTKLMLWVAVDRASKIAQIMGEHDYAIYLQGKAENMKEEILQRSFNEKEGMFTMSYGSKDADASVLLMATMGLLDYQDSRFVSTVLKYKKLLIKNGFVFRYTSKDDFGVPKNSFNICTFWMIQALQGIGESEEAEKLFRNILQHGNHLGLFSEDIDPETGQLLGNFPQTYTHVGLIHVARLLGQNPSRIAGLEG